MNELGIMAAAGASGAVAGILYLTGLRWMLQRLGGMQRPAVWLTAALIARLFLLLAAFVVLAGDGHIERLAAAVIGFMGVRMAVLRRLRPPARTPASVPAKSA